MADNTVTSREVDIDTLVQSVEGDNYNKKEIAYEFSNGVTKEDLGEEGNLYNGS